MKKLTREDLYSLEKYAELREAFRVGILEHKKNRRLAVGPSAALYFEDRNTIQYQIQEMLRIEKIFESAGIEEELGVYNPLIPDGGNWKATFMLEEADVEKRRTLLAGLIGIEDRVWMRIEGHDPVYAIADEDLERSNEEKTSSVHFMRFELTEAMIADAKTGVSLSAGTDHVQYNYSVDPVQDNIRVALLQDLD